MKTKSTCQICKNRFLLKELFPTAMLRSGVFLIAQKKYKDLTHDGYVCIPDLRKINALRFEEILKDEKGKLTNLEEEVLESLKKEELLSENINEEFEEQLTLGDKLADRIAQFGGSWTFISIFALILIVWMSINTFQLLKEPFDPFPYILLNLVLSSLAAIQAPIIMMSQNRQAAKDRLSQEKDYQTNLKSELQIRQLNARMELFMKHYWQQMLALTDVQDEILVELSRDGRI